MTPACDDACLSQRAADLAAAIAMDLPGEDTHFAALRDAIFGTPEPVVAPDAPDDDRSTWDELRSLDGGPWHVAVPDDGAWGAVRVWRGSEAWDVALDAPSCVASLRGDRLLTVEGPGCDVVVVRQLPTLAEASRAGVPFPVERVELGADGWLAVAEDGRARWAHPGGVWDGEVDRHDGHLVGPALFTGLDPDDAAALRFPSGAVHPVGGVGCEATDPVLACTGPGDWTQWRQFWVPTEPPHLGPAPAWDWQPTADPSPVPTGTRAIVVHGPPGQEVQLWRRIGRSWVGARWLRLDATGTATVEGLDADTAWSVTTADGRGGGMVIPPTTLTVHARLAPTPGRPAAAPDTCRVLQGDRVVWSGSCATVADAVDLDHRPFDDGLHEWTLLPFADVPGLGQGEWRAVDAPEVHVGSGRVWGPAAGPVRLVRSGAERACVTVTLRTDGGVDAAAPSPCPLPGRRLRVEDVTGAPAAAQVSWEDPETGAPVRVDAYGSVEVPVGVEGRVDGRPVPADADRVVVDRVPAGRVVAGTFDGTWRSLEAYPGEQRTWVFAGDRVSSPDPGAAPVFVTRRWSNGAVVEEGGEASWWIRTSPTTAVVVHDAERAVVVVRDAPPAPLRTDPDRARCLVGDPSACRTALERAAAAVAAAAWSAGPKAVPLEDVRLLAAGAGPVNASGVGVGPGAVFAPALGEGPWSWEGAGGTVPVHTADFVHDGTRKLVRASDPGAGRFRAEDWCLPVRSRRGPVRTMAAPTACDGPTRTWQGVDAAGRPVAVALGAPASHLTDPTGRLVAPAAYAPAPAPGVVAADGVLVDQRARLDVAPVGAPLEGTWRDRWDTRWFVDAGGVRIEPFRSSPPVDPPWDLPTAPTRPRLFTGRGVTATADGVLVLASPVTALWIGEEHAALLVRESPDGPGR